MIWQSILAWLLFLASALILAGTDRDWAFSYLSQPWQIVVLLIGFVPILAMRPLQQFLHSKLPEIPGNKANYLSKYKVPILILMFLLLLGFILQHPLAIFQTPPDGMGDSLLLLKNIPVHTAIFGYKASFDEWLSILQHSAFIHFGNSLFALESKTALALESYLAFPVFSALLIMFWYARSWTFWGLVIIFIITGSRLALFAGYIENYTWSGLWLILLLLLVVKRFEQFKAQQVDSIPDQGLFLVALGTLFGLATLFHLLNAFIAPALALFCLELARKQPRRSLYYLGITGVSSLVVFGIGQLISFKLLPHAPVLFQAHISNPPFIKPAKWFSTEHMLDMLGVLMLTFPLGLHAGLMSLIHGLRTGIRRKLKLPKTILPLLHYLMPQPLHRILALATLSYMALIFITNTMLGYPADWDLCSTPVVSSGFFLVFRLDYAIQQNEKLGRFMRWQMAAWILLALVFSQGWIRHISQSDSQSMQNLKLVESIQNTAISDTLSHPLWPQIEDNTRQTIFVDLQIFFAEARLKLSRANSPEGLSMLSSINQHDRQLEQWFIASENQQFYKNLAQLYQKLTPINLAMQQM